MLVGHEPTVTVALTLVAPLHASVQSAVTARVSPGRRSTGTELRDPSVLPERWVTKWTTTDAAPWNLASFLRLATGMAARSNVPMPIPSTPIDIVSGGSGVGDGVALGVGVAVGLGSASAWACPSTRQEASPRSRRATGRRAGSDASSPSYGQLLGGSLRVDRCVTELTFRADRSSPTEALALAFLG